MRSKKTVLLLILDGWGARQASEGNAILAAHTPTWDKLLSEYPHTTLIGCGESVGLPEGQMGNSEVGHLTMGAGRIINQDLTQINHTIANESFFQLPLLINTFQKAVSQKQAVHVFGLLSPGGVHSHESHIFTLLKLASHYNCSVYYHAFLDGRDTPPQSAQTSLEKLSQVITDFPQIKLATVMGRFYAMDRDQRWERTQKAFQAIVHAKAPFHAKDGVDALEKAYARNETDEFVQPTLVDPQYPGIQTNDAVIFMNFRSDRARQLSYALTKDHFSGFFRGGFHPLNTFLTLTPYDQNLKAQVIFPKIFPRNGLGEYFQTLGLHQLRIAETEKYAHVTFFFNGGAEPPFTGEDRILIPSSQVKTYDLKPEMSAEEITKALSEAILSQKYDAIICNYANADMVGHTGNYQATLQAIECLDRCMQEVFTALKKVGGEALITADHGNADCMFEPNTTKPHTAHTLSEVPLVYYGQQPLHFNAKVHGSLQDVAPTLLKIMGLTPPPEMTGQSLLVPDQ